MARTFALSSFRARTMVALLFVCTGLQAGVTAVAADGFVGTLPVAGAGPDAIAIDAVTHRVYVAGVDSTYVSIINEMTNTSGGVIDVSRYGAMQPLDVAIDTALGQVIVPATAPGGESVLIFDEESLELRATIPLPGVFISLIPRGVVVDAATHNIYVARPEFGGVAVLNGVTHELIGTIYGAYGELHALALDPGTHMLFAASEGTSFNQIAVINVASNQLVRYLTVPHFARLFGVAVDQKQNRIYASDLQNNTVVVFDLTTGSFLKDVPLPAGASVPEGLAVDQSTDRVYVSARSGVVAVLDARTDAFVSNMPNNAETAVGLGLDSPLGRLYTANFYSDTVSVINLGSGTVVFPTNHGSLSLQTGTAFAEAPPTPDLNLTGDWTVEAWFKDEAGNGFNHAFQQIVMKGDRDASPEAPYYVLIGENHLLAGVRTEGHDYPIDANLAYLGLDPQLWHHVAVTFTASANVLELWLDGRHISWVQVPAHTTVGNTLPLQIGRNGPATGKYWRGKLDDVRIWNVARSGADITASYQTQFTGAESGLVANWHFDERQGSLSADSSGNGHTATLNGGAVFSPEVHP